MSISAPVILVGRQQSITTFVVYKKYILIYIQNINNSPNPNPKPNVFLYFYVFFLH